MGCGSTKSAHPDILVVTHDTPQSFDVTISSSLKDSQKSLNLEARDRRRNMMSAEPINTNDAFDPEAEKGDCDALAEPNGTLDKEPEKKVKKLTEEEVLKKVEEVVPNLLSLSDYNTAECAPGLTFLRKHAAYSPNSARRIRYFDKLAELDVTRLFQKIWSRHFSELQTKGDNDMWNNMKCILVVMWNGTDKSKTLAQCVLDERTYLDVIKWLKDPRVAPSMTEHVRECYVVKGLYGIIHNTLVQCDARHLFREAGIVDTLKPFMHSPNLMVRTKTIINLAFVSTEDEDHLINADSDNFVLLEQILKSCLSRRDHHSTKYGFAANEVLNVLNLLAANDSNKEKIVNTGVLSMYDTLLQQKENGQHWEEEKELAAKGLWTLAFSETCKQQILEMQSLKQSLSNLSSDEGTPDTIKKAANGALWVLEDKDKQQRVLSASKRRQNNQTESEKTHHIMISYNWGSKHTMLAVRDKLKATGFNVWMDVDNMTGSTLEAMAQAVENASLVLVCMTQKYKESPSCRTEAEYVYKLRKPFIPLRLEYKYDPDGWLGIMIGTKLWFDFSVENRFSTSFEGLLRELRLASNIQNNQAVKQEKVQPINHRPPSVNHEASVQQKPKTKVTGWTNDQVKKWMIEKQLTDIVKKFQDFNGEDINELSSMYWTAPEFYYTTLRDNLKLPLLYILRFTKAMKDL